MIAAQFERSAKIMKYIILCLLTAFTVSGQGITIVNPGAETGTLAGWTARNVNFGNPTEPDSLATLTVASSSTLATDGTHSFYLSDNSSITNIEMTLSNRMAIVYSDSYQISFDARIEPGSWTPQVYVRTFGSQAGSDILVGGPFIDISTDSTEFDVISGTLNGFHHYSFTLDSYFVSPGTLPPSDLYLELTFSSGFYSNRTASLYVDNIAIAAIPEPASYALILSLTTSTTVLVFRRRKNQTRCRTNREPTLMLVTDPAAQGPRQAPVRLIDVRQNENLTDARFSARFHHAHTSCH